MSNNEPSNGMTSSRPYLLRAMYDWISDNGLTPHVLVDATQPGVRVPPQTVKDGQVVLNIAMRAVAHLDLGNADVQFQARFGGVSQSVSFPVSAVVAVYARENGQGMMFSAEEEGSAPPSEDFGDQPSAGGPAADEAGGDKPRRGAPHLRVIK